ncbi:hypothetical protein OIU78_015471 [Salix suchowensis]|nr:hypothetical protein OIU78_015471 [Salix suchowensis]
MGIQKVFHRSSSSDKLSCVFNGEVKLMRDNPVLGADSGNDSDDCELAELNCELGMVEGQWCCIPYELYDLPDLREILSLDTWNLCLTEEERFHLSAYLPDMDQEMFCLTMKELFDGSEIYFGNPLDEFFKKLKAGFYPPKVACFREGLQFLQRKQYYHSLRAYHDRMIQKFIDMRRLWDQREMSPGIEENISTWKNQRKQKSINMLDLNESPIDNHLFSEKVTLELKATKASGKPRGVLKMKASGNDSFHSYNSKMVVADFSEHYRSLPKGVLKIVSKVPSVHLEQSDIVPTGVQPDFPAGTHGIRDFKFCPLPASLCFQNTGGLHEYPFLRAKGRRQNTNCLELIWGRFLNKECKSSLDTVGAMPLTFGSENQRANVGREFNGSSLRSLESSPFRIQCQGGERHVTPLKEVHLTTHPRIPEVVPTISDVGNGKQETLMGSFSHQNNGESDVSIRKSEKLSSKSSVSEAFKDQKSLPLTYKRRKVVTKATSLNFGKSLTAGADLKSAIPNESNQDFREGVKTVKIKLMGCP